MAALGVPYDKAQWRKVTTLSGGEQKRLVLEALLRGPEEVLLLDEPDNYLDVPTKRWLEEALVASPKTVLFISHDRELLDRVATRVATLEPGPAGATLWVHPGRFATYAEAEAHCKRIVDGCLDDCYKPGMTADELYSSYTMFGEDPFIQWNSKEVDKVEGRFSAWEYAKARCSEIAN